MRNNSARFKRSFSYFFIIYLILFSAGLNAQNNSKKHRFIFNNDGTYILGNWMYNNRPLSIEDAYSYVDMVANTQITTYMICPGALQPYYESKYESAFGCCNNSAMLDKQDPSLAKPFKIYEDNLKTLKAKGTNIVELCLNRAKEKGMEAFITMRMNDLHFTDTSQFLPVAQGEFWLNHPEYRIGDHQGWHASGAFNYANKEVREFKLNLIKEMCVKFNFDGLELDFQRFLVYFPYKQGSKYLDLMTSFVKDIRKIINEYGRKKNKNVLLTVKIPPSLDLCVEKGLDIKNWLKNRLIDFITVSSHWTDDPALPVAKFTKELGKVYVPIYATIYDGQYYPHQTRSHGIYRAVASHCFYEGADGVYLFNYFATDSILKLKPDVNNPVNIDIIIPLLNELGKFETLKNRNKIYTLSDGVIEYGYKPNTPLPIILTPWDETKISLTVADNMKENKPLETSLFLRITKSSKIICKLNGIPLKLSDARADLVSKYKRNINLKNEDDVLVFTVPLDNLKQGENFISFRSIQPAPFKIERVELLLNCGDVEKYGYF